MKQLNAVADLTITDLSGRIIYHHSSAAGVNSIELNVAQLARGMYVVRVQSRGGERFVGKVVLQ